MFEDQVSTRVEKGRVQHAIKTTKLGITVNVYALPSGQNQDFPHWTLVCDTPLHDPNRGSSRVMYSSQTTTAAAPANTAPIPQAQPVTPAATRGTSPLLLAVTVAVTVARCVLM